MDMMAAITEQQRAITDKNGSLMQQQTTMVTWLKTTAEWLETMIENQDANMVSLESAAVSSPSRTAIFVDMCARMYDCDVSHPSISGVCLAHARSRLTCDIIAGIPDATANYHGYMANDYS